MSREWMQRYFDFNRHERKIVLILLLLVIIVFMVLFSLRNYQSEPIEDYRYLDQYMDSINVLSKGSMPNYSFHKFDPNSVTSQELISMGISQKNAQTFLKYRKYKKFKEAKEMKKLYFMTDELFKAMEPYISIENKGLTKAYSDNKIPIKAETKVKYKTHNIDANTADTAELKLIYGIGSYTARQIVWYRNRLGGYVNLNQLKEVKGMHAENFEKVSKELFLSKVALKKIIINEAGWKELVSHPYINKDQANKIIKHKREFGNIQAMDELVAIQIFSKNEAEKLKPYLNF